MCHSLSIQVPESDGESLPRCVLGPGTPEVITGTNGPEGRTVLWSPVSFSTEVKLLRLPPQDCGINHSDILGNVYTGGGFVISWDGSGGSGCSGKNERKLNCSQ